MKKILLLAATLLLLASCGGKKKADNSWLTSNDVKIAIDETFQPIMAEQLQQFGLSHVQANLLPLYCRFCHSFARRRFFAFNSSNSQINSARATENTASGP